ncbi:MAG: hypothetical protein D6813_00885 [Calditrichaeota bacterium]|nr:MAG: hypothetical protein D6813_00885 [Calditrichota bacterium]
MVQISFTDNDAILKFLKQWVSSAYVQDFLQRLRLEAIVEKSRLTEEQAWELSEEIKQEWWQKIRKNS